MSLTGYPGYPPARAGIPIADLGGGMMAALGVLGGLASRDRTGEGVMLDISLLDCQISMLMYWTGLALNLGMDPGPQGSGNTNVYPYGAYATSDGFVVVAPYSGSFWPKLCDAVGHPELVADQRFDENAHRVENRDELEVILNAAFLKRTTSEWVEILDRYDVPNGPVNTVEEAMRDHQVIDRGMRLEMDIEGNPFTFSGNPIKTLPDSSVPAMPAPRLGQHTREVLKEVLSFDTELIDDLNERGVICVEDPTAPTWKGVPPSSGS
jgi:crotonobetainyl-CoA:carnitine CoA-transferase CaiB-like acyl-CoA transferase